jgi:hypothetical protein
MFGNLAYSDAFVRMRVDELLREAENDRLADLAAGPGRPARSRIAEWLVALAARIDSQPQAATIARAEA